MCFLLFVSAIYATISSPVILGFSTQMNTGPLSKSFALLGEPETGIVSAVAGRLRMESVNLPDLLLGKKGCHTDRVKADAVKMASDAAQGSWLLSGFGETAAERRALRLVGVALDRFVVLTRNHMSPPASMVAPTEGRVDFVHLPSSAEDTEVVRAILDVVNDSSSDMRRGGDMDAMGGGTKSETKLGKVPWYAPFIKCQKRQRNHSDSPQVYSVYNSSKNSTALNPMKAKELEQSIVLPNSHSKGNIEFGGLKLPPLIASRLSAAGIVTPTGIQSASMLPISAGESILIHSMTGSGKTLAFLVPVLCQLQPKLRRQVLVVVPTRELALQVAREAILLCGGRMDAVKLVVSLEEEASGFLHTRSPVLVGTAKAIQKTLHKTLQLKQHDVICNMKTLVCDEIDRLVDPIGRYTTQKQIKAKKRHDRPIAYILEKLLSARPDLQVVACSATIGRPLRRYLNGVLSVASRELKSTTPRSLRIIRDETLGCSDVRDFAHKRAVDIPSCIRHCILPLAQSDIDEKLDALLQALVSLKPSRPLVFLPDGERLAYAVLKLQNAGMRSLPVHEALGFMPGQQLHASEAIIASNKLDEVFRETKTTILEHQNATAVSESRNGQDFDYPILVASQAGARGLHFEEIDYVFILGRPKDPNEYAHLAGRTGRRGQHGVVISILSYRDGKNLKRWGTQLQITFEQLTDSVMEKEHALTA